MRRGARPLLYLGIVAIVFGTAKAHATWVGHYDLTGSGRFAWTFVYAGLLCATAYGFGLPEIPRTRAHAVGASVGAAFTAAAAMSVLQLVAGDALLPRFVVFGAALLLPDWYRICIQVAAGGRLRAEARDRVAVVARADEVAALDLELHGLPERPASVVLRLSIEEATGEGTTLPLVAAAGEHRPTVLVLDRAAQDDDGIVAQAAILHERGIRVRTLSGFYEGWLGKLPVSELERASLLFDIGEVHRAGYGRAKRLLDVPVALVGLLALALVLPVVWVANLAGNRGPLLYRQERVGKGGRPFTLIKLRTMLPEAGEEQAPGEWTSVDDARVTPVGRVLRRTHLDELPQVLNILRGDLSVVGPRPEQPHYVAELSDKLPFYRLRHLVRPGLTGWAQVKYGYAGSESDALEKLQYEFWYLRHQSLRTDARIVGRTARSVVGSEGRGR